MSPVFVVQRHHATALHFDLRLQINDVLASWAVPKGPTLDPGVKRLARQVGDHDLEHASFEGRTPGTGGPGTVIVWDTGTYEHLTERDGVRVGARDAVDAGHVKVRLHGHRLHGQFALTRTSMGGDPRAWILVKLADEEAVPDYRAPLTSVLTGRTNLDLEGDGAGDDGEGGGGGEGGPG